MGGAGFWGPVGYPGMRLKGVETCDAESEIEEARRQHEDPHLRRCNVVTGYPLHASDDEIGHVQGLLIVNTSNWWFGHQVLSAPEWIQRVSWTQSTVAADLTRQAVRESPAYDSATSLSPDAEAGIYQHYGRNAYGKDQTTRKIA